MPDPFDLDDESVQSPVACPATAPADAVWLDGLNPEQRAAVAATEGPLLVLSGAGTGKTRVLTTRLAHILMTGRARPWNLLAVTFTNKAAREMRERVAALVGPAAEQVWLGTFHALGARMLRRHADLVGLKGNFTILDTDDQVRLLKQLMEGGRIDSKKWPAQALMSVIQRWKDRGRTPAAVIGEGAARIADGRAVELYRQYQDRLRTLNACDFGDLLLHCLTIFQNAAHADVLAEFQNQFRYILVDEYQDTNVAQYLWLRLLAQKHRNICCVGDDDQAIYSWRGAEVANILRFEHDFPGARVVRLETNYRSTPAILAAASGLIDHNQGRLGKTLRPGPENDHEGDPIVVRGLWDGTEEARWVVDEIEVLQRSGTALQQIAVLVRAGFQTRAFEERLITCGLPYRVWGGLRFYERQEIRDALAYFRVVAQPDDDLAFERIVNLPKRSLGPASLQPVHVLARQQQIPLVEAARRLVGTDEINAKPRSVLTALLDDFDRWRSLLSSMHHAALAAAILEESGYVGMWRQDTAPDAPGRVENLKELVAALEDFDNLARFLEHVSLVTENDERIDVDQINIMTLHSAKGLEFDAVFLPGWEEGLFPHARALEDSGAEGLEEERRLAYVGLTRARRRAFVSYAASRRIYNRWQTMLPSRFVRELPGDMLETQPGQVQYGAVGGQAAQWQADREGARSMPWSAMGTAPLGGFRPGNRIFHQKFGYGLILSVDGNKLEIAFDAAGTKKVVDSFVCLA
jgi:DNA helicase-2/ATP-dependent DNA helicase PcrA